MVQTTKNGSSLNLARDLTERIRGANPQEPLARGLVDVGFSSDGANRITQHLGNTGSNAVMHDFKNSAAAIFGQHKHVLNGYVVCRLRKFNYCSIAELIISRLSQSYTDRGGGFNGAVAGGSITGARNLPPIAWDQIGAVEHSEYYKRNIADDKVKIQELRDAAERRKEVAMDKALQKIMVEAMPRDHRERLWAKENANRAELRGQFDEHLAGESSVGDQEDEAETPNQQFADYSSDIGFSSQPVRGRPAPRAHGNDDDSNDEDPIETSSV